MLIFNENIYTALQMQDVLNNAPFNSFIINRDILHATGNTPQNYKYTGNTIKIYMKVSRDADVSRFGKVDVVKTGKDYKIISHTIPDTEPDSQIPLEINRFGDYKDDYIMWYLDNKIPEFFCYDTDYQYANNIKPTKRQSEKPLKQLFANFNTEPGIVSAAIYKFFWNNRLKHWIDEINSLQIKITHIKSNQLQTTTLPILEKDLHRLRELFYTHKENRDFTLNNQLKCLSTLSGKNLTYEVTNFKYAPTATFSFPYRPTSIPTTIDVTYPTKEDATALLADLKEIIDIQNEDPNNPILKIAEHGNEFRLKIRIDQIWGEDNLEFITCCYAKDFKRAMDGGKSLRMCVCFREIAHALKDSTLNYHGFSDETARFLELFDMLLIRDKTTQGEKLAPGFLTTLIENQEPEPYGCYMNSLLVHLITKYLEANDLFVNNSMLALKWRKELFNAAFATRDREGNQSVVDANFHFLLTGSTANWVTIQKVGDDNTNHNIKAAYLNMRDEYNALIKKYRNTLSYYDVMIKHEQKAMTRLSSMMEALQNPALQLTAVRLIAIADAIRDTRLTLKNHVSQIEKDANKIKEEQNPSEYLLKLFQSLGSRYQQLFEQYMSTQNASHEKPGHFNAVSNDINTVINKLNDSKTELTEDDYFNYAAILRHIEEMSDLLKNAIAKRKNPGFFDGDTEKRLRTGQDINNNNANPTPDKPNPTI